MDMKEVAMPRTPGHLFVYGTTSRFRVKERMLFLGTVLRFPTRLM